MKLDLGAGDTSPDGYTPMGHRHGSEVYPLSFPDCAIDAIHASHILEHFPHGEIDAVLREWFRVLKPGGTLRIAVPDFGRIAEAYVAGEPQNVQGYLMGGQVDRDDYHRTIFDEQALKRHLAGAGLVLIRRWQSEIADCASLPVSLNLEGTKPHQAEIGVSAVMSAPRLGFMDNFCVAQEGLRAIGSRVRVVRGAYWGQCLERGIEETLREDNPDAVLTLDYDSVFAARDLAMLMQLMMAHPEADAIAALQAGRGMKGSPLLTVRGPSKDDSKTVRVNAAETFGPDLARVATAHFGLTLIRSDRLRSLPKPWFLDAPDDSGGWGEGRTDADIGFWRKWEAAGFSLHVANRVPIGHLELGVLWPGRDLQAIFQPVSDWRERGAPEAVWR